MKRSNDDKVTMRFEAPMIRIHGECTLHDVYTCVGIASIGVLRIIQSIPSRNAEHIKQWLAQVGADKLEDDAKTPMELRAQRRREFARADQLLHEVVYVCGLVTQDQLDALDDANYGGLYDVPNKLALIRQRGIVIWTDDPADYMGPDELAINTFHRVMTRGIIQNRGLTDHQHILDTAYDTGVQIRLMIQRAGGILPEEYRREKFLVKGAWMTEEELTSSSQIDWSTEDTE